MPTEVRLTVPADPRVSEFEKVVVSAFEHSVSDAHRTATRTAVREVHAQLQDHLACTPYHLLPQVCRGPGDLEREAQKFHHDAYGESDERLQVAAHYTHAQDLTLGHHEHEMEVLRRSWDNCIGHNTMLKGQIKGLSRCLERLDQMNRRLRDGIYAASDLHDDRDARKIPILAMRVALMEKAIHARGQAD